MIELLILYVLEKRDRTMYSVRKEIADLFGVFTKPSDGTVHPALERLLKKGCVAVSERMSEGGKKSTFYSLTKEAKNYAKELLLTKNADNPSVLYVQLQSKLSVLSFFDEETKKIFFDEELKHLELMQIEIKNAINNKYKGLDIYQKNMHNEILEQLKRLENIIRGYQK